MKKNESIRVIYPYRVDNEDGTRTEYSYIIKRFECVDRPNIYDFVPVETNKNWLGETIDERLGNYDLPPDNAVFNVAQGWSRGRIEDFIKTFRCLFVGVGTKDDYALMESLFDEKAN